MSDVFYSNGLCFSCRQCSACCRHEPGFVYLSLQDLDNLCAELSVPHDEFIKIWCRWVPYYDGTEVLALIEKKNFDCIFWENGCKVYKNRPVQCSAYPFWSYIISSEETWREESMSCPGINNGEIIPPEIIVDKMTKHRDNKPLNKKCFEEM